MISNHYQSFDLSLKSDSKKFQHEFNEMVSDYGKPQSSFGTSDTKPYVRLYQWFVYDPVLDISEIFTILVYKSNHFERRCLYESKQMD